MGVVGRLDQYASMLAWEFDETTANGPRITGLGTYYASEFNENLSDDLIVEYLIVAGGGGGGGSYSGLDGGGGGAGGLLQGLTTLVTGSYSLTVGAGGAPGAFNGNVGPPGYNGGNSIGFGLTAIGGGGGGSETSNGGYFSILRGVSGGSGGGGIGNWGNQLGGSGTVGQGNAGGTGYDSPPYIGGGGGGAGQIGADGYALSAGKGGDGLLSSITGISTYYAGGGSGGRGLGGGLGGGGNSGVSGVANKGGGGGNGASGGSGVIIIRYPGPQRATGGVVSTSGTYTIHTFTSVGSTTFTVSPSSSSITPILTANILPPYDPVYDEFGGTLFGAGQGRYMRQNTDKSVIVYNEIDEVTNFYNRGNIVTNGLVLDLDAGINPSYPGIETAWYDLSGNGNTGTLVNGVSYVGSNGGSLSFDGTNDHASIPHSSSLSFSSALTISIWFYSGTVGAGAYLYLKGRTDIDNYNPLIISNGYYAWTGVNGRAQYINPANYILDNTWYNLTVSHTSGSTPNIYKNATLATSHTFTEGNGTYALGINNDAVGINADIPRSLITSFNGRISSLQAYNRALSAAEVSQNFNAVRNRYGL